MFTLNTHLQRLKITFISLLLTMLVGCSSLNNSVVTQPPSPQLNNAVFCDKFRGYNTVVNAPNEASLPIDRDHIFCGEVTGKTLKAKGFHSRPGGLNPVTVSNTDTPPHANNERYDLTGFNITQNGHTEEKSLSTMFPDSCSYIQVLNSVAYAYNNSVAGPSNSLIGPSSPIPVNVGGVYCLERNDAFQITMFLGDNTVIINNETVNVLHIRTAHPY